jgi:hypothetical protein
MEYRFLHLYLADQPEETEIQTILEFYGFELTKTVPQEGKDPNEYHYRWNHQPLSGSGLELIYHDQLFTDDAHAGSYGTFIVLEGSKASSALDLSMMDVTAKFLIDRYGGTIRNPNHAGQPLYLCGKART